MDEIGIFGKELFVDGKEIIQSRKELIRFSVKFNEINKIA
jgi:hypothetical protein